jgi:hypothetical protein
MGDAALGLFVRCRAVFDEAPIECVVRNALAVLDLDIGERPPLVVPWVAALGLDRLLQRAVSSMRRGSAHALGNLLADRERSRAQEVEGNVRHHLVERLLQFFQTFDLESVGGRYRHGMFL